jgi:hypothetical protein
LIFRSFVDDDHINTTAFNHETGHALGLCDAHPTPAPPATPPPSPIPCGSWSQDLHCVNSIMHSCEGDTSPTSQDIDSVENLIPVGGSSQGGSAGGGCGKAFGSC